MKFLSEETIELVKRVSVYEVAENLGFHLKQVGTYWNIECPNPDHCEKEPQTYISMSTGYFKCYSGGGCGADGFAIQFFSWHQFGRYSPKEDFIRSVEGIARLMGIPVKYSDGSISQDNTRPTYIPKEQPKIVEIPAASPDICDQTYRRFLDLCPVFDEHLEEWLGPKRQYTKEQVEVIGLRSLPKTVDQAKKIVDTLISEGYQIERVPGFTQYLRKDGKLDNDQDWYWLIVGMGKYYIPIRDDMGRIIRLRIRTNFEDKKKYIWFSSAPMNNGKIIRRGGAGAGAHVNVIVPSKLMALWEPGTEITNILNVKKVLIIEGEHKGYIVSELLNMLVISIPGVGNFRDVIPLLKKWGVQEVAIAYDVDAFYDEKKKTGKNENVYKQLVRFGKALISEENIHSELWVWNPKDGKGLDDLILGQKLPIITNLRTNERSNLVLQSSK